MNYQKTIEYLYDHLPVFHRIGMDAYKPDLRNISALCDLNGSPQLKFRSVHVGGTNGKGSVSNMLAAILQTVGYKTGLYTSPHLRDFRERIRVNGQMIPKRSVINFVRTNRSIIENLSPSFFEVTAAMAFSYFAAREVDIAIIEVGMGGRLDSTNIIMPVLSVITNIGYDHMNVLGNSLEKIAAEKAGIIKKDIPIVIGEYHPDTAPVFVKKATEMGSPVSFASEDWQILSYEPERAAFETEAAGSAGPEIRADLLKIEVPAESMEAPAESGDLLKIEAVSDVYGSHQHLALDLTAGYQRKNIKTVLSAVEKLKLSGFQISTEHARKALAQVKLITGFAGRWQIIDRNPLVVCDTGHNEDGIREVLDQIAHTAHDGLHMVFGMVNDKEVEKILGMLPPAAHYYFCKASVPRALDENLLRVKAAASGLKGESHLTVQQALQAARQNAGPRDLIFVGGSTFVVAEVV